VTSNSLGSTEILVSRSRSRSSTPSATPLTASCGTAGAVTLMLQAALPFMALRAPGTVVRLTGGTHVQWSPLLPFLRLVLEPTLREHLSISLAYPTEPLIGMFPRGGGAVTVSATLNAAPPLRPLTLATRGSVASLHIDVVVAVDPKAPTSPLPAIARRMIET
jgi:RNA 3'-terminal phosphate cyclase